MRPVVLAVTGDWHVNDITALAPPIFKRALDSTNRAGKLQRAIWRAWLEYWELVGSIKAEMGATVINVYLGDLGDLNKYSTAELISTYKPDIQNALLDVSEPARAVSDYDIVIRGTESHVGAAGELEEWFAHDISAEQSPEGHNSWWAWRGEVAGVRVHATHHPPTGTKLPHKHGQAVARSCEYLAAEYHLYGWRDKPQLALWGHRHWCARGEEMGIEGWMCPPWKGLGGYGRKIGITLPNPVGGLIAILPGDGTWTVKRFLRHPPRARAWRMNQS